MQYAETALYDGDIHSASSSGLQSSTASVVMEAAPGHPSLGVSA